MLALVPLALLLAACSSYQLARLVLPIAEEGKPIPELEKLCETEAGVHIYEQPRPVKGFVLMPLTSYAHGPDQPATDQGWGGCRPVNCLYYLVGRGYDFIEAPYNDTPNTLPRDFADVIDRPDNSGLYRYRLVSHGEGRCKTFDFFVKYEDAFRYELEKYKERLGDRCIVAEPIPSFTARYQVEWNDIWRAITDYDGVSGGVVSESQHIIRDRKTGKVLARGSSFYYQNVHFINRHLGSCVAKDLDGMSVEKILPSATERTAQGN